MAPLRVLVCGGRDYLAESKVFAALEDLYVEHGSLVVIEGGAPGADRAAELWAKGAVLAGATVEHLQFKANWREHGKSAGPKRNGRMIVEGRPNLVLAFPGGRGTRDMVNQAKRNGLEVQYGG